jgi:hypothetical protein
MESGTRLTGDEEPDGSFTYSAAKVIKWMKVFVYFYNAPRLYSE